MGPMGAGKTCAADYLVDQYEFKRVSLAEPVKAIDRIRDRPKSEWDDLLMLAAQGLFPDPVYGKFEYLGYCNAREYVADQWHGILSNVEDRRTRLQRIGTDVGRRVNPLVWILWFARHLPDGDLVVDDLRFENEVYALRDLAFKTVKILKPESLRVEHLVGRDGFFDPSTQGHASETELEGCVAGYQIDNATDDHEDFEREIMRLLYGVRNG